jgi:hypothetical protein
MDVLVLLWSASVFAAISFFAAGLATHAAMVRRRSTPVLAQGPDPQARAREHAARTRIAELEAGLAAASAMRDDQLAGSAEVARRAEAELARVRTALVTAERGAATAEQRATAAELRATTLERRATVSDQRATVAEQRATVAEQRATALEQRANAAEQRAVSLDGELVSTQARVTALDAEILAKAAPKRAPAPVRTRHPLAANRQEDTVEGSLAGCLGTFADECGYEVVVLSDAQGLLLAGVGDNEIQGTIAALSSVARELTTRAAEFVELRPKLIEVTDDAGRTLRIRLFQWEQEPIALASFGIGHGEPTQEEETVITVFPTLMAAS